jgi:hypothetical protein
MPLSSNSIKTTIRFTNVTGSTSIPASKGAVWYQGIVTTGMMFGQIPPFVSNSSLTLEELADPDHSPSQKILFNELTFVFGCPYLFFYASKQCLSDRTALLLQCSGGLTSVVPSFWMY